MVRRIERAKRQGQAATILGHSGSFVKLNGQIRAQKPGFAAAARGFAAPDAIESFASVDALMGSTANGTAPPDAPNHAGAPNQGRDLHTQRSPDDILDREGILDRAGGELDGLSPLEAAALEAVAYADIFDYPLTASEIHRYLPGIAASAAEVEAALAGEPLTQRLHRRDDYYLLPGRDGTVSVRRRRAERAARLWPIAHRYGRAIAAMPFVRMVAITGSLAMNNVDDGGDIDYLIVTEPGRLWLCRALIILIVRAAARRGDNVCPNFFLSERALRFDDHTLYTARELVQMRPLFGFGIYRRIRAENRWAMGFLPNADGPPPAIAADGAHFDEPGADEPRLPAWRGPAEALLRTPVGGWLEQWEMERKIRKLSSRARPAVGEVEFSADRCRGHFEGHAGRTLRAYSSRIDTLTRPRAHADLDTERTGIERTGPP